MLKRKINRDQVNYLKENSHLSNIELAEILKVLPQDIANYKKRLRKKGLVIPKFSRNKRISEQRKKFIKENESMTNSELAEKLKILPSTVSSYKWQINKNSGFSPLNK